MNDIDYCHVEIPVTPEEDEHWGTRVFVTLPLLKPIVGEFYGIGTVPLPVPPDPEGPLHPTAPPSWDARIKRVEWCLANLTRGERHLLYRMMYNDGVRYDNCRDEERKERKSLE